MIFPPAKHHIQVLMPPLNLWPNKRMGYVHEPSSQTFLGWKCLHVNRSVFTCDVTRMRQSRQQQQQQTDTREINAQKKDGNTRKKRKVEIPLFGAPDFSD